MSKAVQCSSNHMANFPIYIDIHTFASAFIKKHVLILLTLEYYTWAGIYLPIQYTYMYIYTYTIFWNAKFFQWWGWWDRRRIRWIHCWSWEPQSTGSIPTRAFVMQTISIADLFLLHSLGPSVPPIFIWNMKYVLLYFTSHKHTQIHTHTSTQYSYQVTKQLGEGGCAIIYAAKDVTNGQEYALKRFLGTFIPNT